MYESACLLLVASIFFFFWSFPIGAYCDFNHIPFSFIISEVQYVPSVYLLTVLYVMNTVKIYFLFYFSIGIPPFPVF